MLIFCSETLWKLLITPLQWGVNGCKEGFAVQLTAHKMQYLTPLPPQLGVGSRDPRDRRKLDLLAHYESFILNHTNSPI